jgi:chromosome transmission fidelity protein 18
MEVVDGFSEWNRKSPGSWLVHLHSSRAKLSHLPCRPLDTLASFATSTTSSSATPPVRYAIRQVLDQEYNAHKTRARAIAREARSRPGTSLESTNEEFGDEGKENNSSNVAENSKPISAAQLVKRDFFGRVIVNNEAPLLARPWSSDGEEMGSKKKDENAKKVWLHYHEGFSNAVRKPVTMAELMAGL